jgi:hypothetical protein
MNAKYKYGSIKKTFFYYYVLIKSQNTGFIMPPYIQHCALAQPTYNCLCARHGFCISMPTIFNDCP